MRDFALDWCKNHVPKSFLDWDVKRSANVVDSWWLMLDHMFRCSYKNIIIRVESWIPSTCITFTNFFLYVHYSILLLGSTLTLQHTCMCQSGLQDNNYVVVYVALHIYYFVIVSPRHQSIIDCIRGMCALQKPTGCFNHRVVTLVAVSWRTMVMFGSTD